MTADLIAVLDVGKTNAKIAFVEARTGVEVWSHKRVNRSVATPLGRELDIGGIEQWLVQALSHAPEKRRVSIVVPIAHGAAAVLLDEHGDVVAAPDYEDPCFELVSASYEAQRDSFDNTLSPNLPLGLNLGRQLFYLQHQHPDVFGRVAHVLLFPQYWAWRLAGVLASEITSLGTHTDLWCPQRKSFSSLANAHDWPRLFPPVKFAGERLGPLTELFQQRTGLNRDCQVVCGIHDSNASYLQHLIARPAGEAFAVVSSGTWTVVMVSGASPARLHGKRDMLGNVDAFGSVVATARFMGGREYEAIAGSMADPDEESLATVLQRHVMAIPSFARGGPFSAYAGKVLSAGHVTEKEQAAVATLYVALMTDLLLDSLEAQGDVIVDGPLSANALFAPLLAAFRPASRILTAPVGTGCAGAVCYLAGAEMPRTADMMVARPASASGLQGYRLAWRGLLPEAWPEDKHIRPVLS